MPPTILFYAMWLIIACRAYILCSVKVTNFMERNPLQGNSRSSI